ncbi:hypothetical protein RFI_22123 [Reticulomyxa filosa]|uniref:Uncharacterized protein n=1 Tax=Reticulomyxa filosa TaxID=46433 RepID=X6MNJ3_RETFI|nr:hypothetical protein RFI_22123 [Reticulomyxa filosa]|eukprot:ETO15241.1 hypothetical protein RFI_22123 [Reticulomyxa filosa]
MTNTNGCESARVSVIPSNEQNNSSDNNEHKYQSEKNSAMVVQRVLGNESTTKNDITLKPKRLLVFSTTVAHESILARLSLTSASLPSSTNHYTPLPTCQLWLEWNDTYVFIQQLVFLKNIHAYIAKGAERNTQRHKKNKEFIAETAIASFERVNSDNSPCFQNSPWKSEIQTGICVQPGAAQERILYFEFFNNKYKQFLLNHQRHFRMTWKKLKVNDVEENYLLIDIITKSTTNFKKFKQLKKLIKLLNQITKKKEIHFQL